MRSISFSGKFIALAKATEYLETEDEWSFVYSSLASIALANEVTTSIKWF